MVTNTKNNSKVKDNENKIWIKASSKDMDCPVCGGWTEVNDDVLGDMSEEELYEEGYPMHCSCGEEFYTPKGTYVPRIFNAVFKNTCGCDEAINIMKIVIARNQDIATHLANKDATINSESQMNPYAHSDFAQHRELVSITEMCVNFPIASSIPEEFLIEEVE